MLQLIAGDTVTLKADIIDGETLTPIDATDVSGCVVKIGDNYTRTLTDGAIEAVDSGTGQDFIKITLSADDTDDFSNQQSVRCFVKVSLSDGRISTIVEGERLLFTVTPTTDL